eukprot:5242402-Alexandrium_andersonii.AAC.1
MRASLSRLNVLLPARDAPRSSWPVSSVPPWWLPCQGAEDGRSSGSVETRVWLGLGAGERLRV